jgi:DNA recombination protein RmuC
MEQHVLIALGIGLVIGLCAGAAAVWLLLRKSADIAATQAKSESQVEIARLGERISSGTTEVSQLRPKLEAAEAKITELRQQLEESHRDRVRFEERANRVPGVEENLKTATADNEGLKHQLADLREKLGGAESTTSAQHERISALEIELSELTTKRDKLLTDQEQLKTQVGQLNTSIEAERRQSTEKLALLNEAKDQLSASFKALANDILEEKAQRFTEQNKANIGQILEPLKTKIDEFKSKVEEVYVQEGKDRTALAEQVKQLMGLNQQLSQEANNLTLALKGSSKTQGNWGEMVLERVLEDSGLRKDVDYFMRPSYTKEDGSRVQPDAVIRLPENRNLVLDAKVSLVAYEEYTSAASDSGRATAIQRHVASVRGHINMLSASNYQSIEALKSLDFAIMFVPIEPAFIVAVANDSKLWQEAWQKSVLLVSPSSLLFVVRIVANLWRQELQKRSVQEIFKRVAELYDKFVGFVEDLKTLGTRLEQARDSYSNAYAKLYTGKGNVIRRAEMLKELGVKPSKALPPELVESAIEVSALPATTEDGPGSGKIGQL